MPTCAFYASRAGRHARELHARLGGKEHGTSVRRFRPAASSEPSKLYQALDSQRREPSFTWPQLAPELQCNPSQLTGIKRALFAIGMRLAMRIVTWLDRPARDFVHAAN
jgi:hypothetical protein